MPFTGKLTATAIARHYAEFIGSIIHANDIRAKISHALFYLIHALPTFLLIVMIIQAGIIIIRYYHDTIGAYFISNHTLNPTKIVIGVQGKDACNYNGDCQNSVRFVTQSLSPSQRVILVTMSLQKIRFKKPRSTMRIPYATPNTVRSLLSLIL